MNKQCKTSLPPLSKPTKIFAAILVGCSISTLTAVAAPISIAPGSLSYDQDFDSLTMDHGTTLPWVNDPATDGVDGLAGWFIEYDGTKVPEIRGSAGGNSTSRNYSYAVSSSSTDRALGSLAAGSTGAIRTGVSFVNNTGSTITGFTIEYDGEQWRIGQNNDNNNQITVAYQIFSSGTGSVSAGGYTSLPAATFDSPQENTDPGSSSSLDGNDPANRIANLSATELVSWNPGDELWIRFFDNNSSGFDHGLAIDNLTFTAIPEPGTPFLAGLALIVLGLRCVRSKSRP